MLYLLAIPELQGRQVYLYLQAGQQALHKEESAPPNSKLHEREGGEFLIMKSSKSFVQDNSLKNSGPSEE